MDQHLSISYIHGYIETMIMYIYYRVYVHPKVCEYVSSLGVLSALPPGRSMCRPEFEGQSAVRSAKERAKSPSGLTLRSVPHYGPLVSLNEKKTEEAKESFVGRRTDPKCWQQPEQCPCG